MLFSGLLAAVGAGGAAAAGTAGAATGAAGVAAGSAAAATTGAVAGGAGGIGTALGLAGTGFQVIGQFKAQAAAKRAEALREQQMKLDATRQRRQIIREAIVARGQAVSNASNQGALGGSGIQGGIAQITNRANQAIVGVNQNEKIGSQIFDANADIASGQTISSIGSGLSSLGGAFVDNQQTIGKLGTYYG